MCDDKVSEASPPPPSKKPKLSEKPPDPPPVGVCAHWVYRKKRYCKLVPPEGREYCAEHEPPVQSASGQEGQGGERITCPLDSKHTVYRKNLKKHLKICNARPRDDNPPYIVPGVNNGQELDFKAEDDLKLSDLGDEEFFQVIDKVKKLYDQYIEGQQLQSLSVRHSILDEELANPVYGKDTRKHLEQAAALLGILEQEQQIQSDTAYLEFGAGKGQLAFYMAQLLQQQQKENSQVILLDRMSLRHKKDNKIEDRSLVQRIRVDIADFRMEEFDLLSKSKCNVAVSKHLCGGATDLTLRCITRAANTSDSKAISTDFIMIALCCHHRCDWRSFVGKDFFQQHKLTPRDFLIMTRMSCWCTCGTGFSREKMRELKERSVDPQDVLDQSGKQRLTLVQREEIGFKCKRVLDYARLLFLQEQGYDVSLKLYVSKEITLENVCLLARRRRK